MRELRGASRRRGTYWLRTLAGAAVVGLGAWVVAMAYHETEQEVGKILFWLLTGSATFFALIGGVRSTADCLSEEKREGTLGLLFLTDLKGYDVVLGKLVANSLNTFYCVACVIPMFAIPILLGGITLGEVGRMALVALNALFFSLSVGMCVSAFCRSAIAATGLASFIVVFLTALLPAIGGLLAQKHSTSQVAPFFLWPGTGFTYYLALDGQFQKAPEYFWYSLGIINGLGWCSLLLASYIAPRAWQDNVSGLSQLTARWRNVKAGGRRIHSAWQRLLLEQNAYFWLSSRDRWRPWRVWFVLVALAIAWFWGFAKVGRDWLNEPVFITTAVIVNFIIRTWFATEAARQISDDRKAGTLELLITTPLSVRDIVRGQSLALQRQFAGPVGVIIAVQIVFMLAQLKGYENEDRTLWVCFWLAVTFMLLADLVALYWLGMWHGLTSRSLNHAAGASNSRILLLPWLLIGMVTLVLALVSRNSSSSPDLGPKFFLGLWFFLGVAVDIYFAADARSKLLTRFRTAAAQRFEKRVGFWQRLAGQRKPAG
jgi:hypothetical protein